MVRKVKKKKSEIRVFVTLLLITIIVAFVYKSIVTPEKYPIFVEEDDRKITAVPPSEIKLDPSVAIVLDQLNSSNAILIRL